MTLLITEAQENEILRLAGQLDGSQHRRLTDVTRYLPVSKTALRNGNVTRAEASNAIDALRERIKARDAARATNAPIDANPTAAQVLATLGQHIDIEYTTPEGTIASKSGLLDSVIPSGIDGTPAVHLDGVGTYRISAITALRIT